MAVETKLDTLIESNKQLIQVVSDLKTNQGNYVPKEQYEIDLAKLEAKIERSKQRSGLQTWITSSLAALFGVIMTILIQSYLTK